MFVYRFGPLWSLVFDVRDGFRVSELRILRPVERDATPLNLVAAVIGVEAVATPVRVSVVGVG